MESPQDHDAQLLAAGGSPAALVRNKPRVLEEFTRRMRERFESARVEPRPVIINTLPAFITRLALALVPGNDLDFASEYSNIALAHGNERAKLTGYSLIRRDAEPGQHGHFAGRALYNLRRIDRMIQELLDASRANAGVGTTLNLERVEAGSLAREVIGDLTLRAGDRFVLEAKEPVHGWWDPERVKQALHNLLEDAVKYGAEYSRITCRVGCTAGRLFLAVHNLGEPIPPETIPVLFQPFRRALSAERSTKSGWGLRLVMVQAIAEAHGGSVALESSASDGTVFTLDTLRDARQKLPEADSSHQ